MQPYLPLITSLKDQGRAILDNIEKYVHQPTDSYARMEVQNEIFKLWEVNIAIKFKRLHQVGLTRMYDRYENHKISTNNTNIGHKLERTRWSTSPHPPQIHLKNTRIDILMKKGLSRSYVVVQCTHYQHSILYMHYMHKHKSICIYMVYTNPYMHTYECECMLHIYIWCMHVYIHNACMSIEINVLPLPNHMNVLFWSLASWLWFEYECMQYIYTHHACPLKSTWFHFWYICYFDVIQVVCGLVEALVHWKRSDGWRRYYHHVLRRRL